MLYWINANSEPGANVRAAPKVTSEKPIRTLTTSGALVERVGSLNTSDGHTWHEYVFADSGRGWIRDDVHERVELANVTVQLDVPYKSQNDADSDDHSNDCGPASLAMMINYAGITVTVDEVSEEAGLVGSNFSHFNDLIRAAKAWDFKAAHRAPFRLTDVLASLVQGYPVLSLVYYHHLMPGKKYGHFLVPVGYLLEANSKSLSIVVHDPNDGSNAVYPASQFADALAYRGSTQNGPFQSLVFTNWADFVTPKEPNDPIEDTAKERAIQILLDAMQQSVIAMKHAAEILGG